MDLHQAQVATGHDLKEASIESCRWIERFTITRRWHNAGTGSVTPYDGSNTLGNASYTHYTFTLFEVYVVHYRIRAVTIKGSSALTEQRGMMGKRLP